MYILWNIKKKEIESNIDEINILDDLYYSVTQIPTIEQIKEYHNKYINKQTKEVVYLDSNYKSLGSWKLVIELLKKNISTINIKIPLYDEYSYNMFLISRDYIYEKVIYYHYRFPEKLMIEQFKKTKEKYQKKTNVKLEDLELLNTKSMSEFTDLFGEKYKKDILEIRHYKKILLILKFLSNFNIDVLYSTYKIAFYEYSIKTGKNITICKRPSFKPFFSHIKPYYTRSELINLGLNMKLIKPDTKYYTIEDINNLCNVIKENDITNETLLKHQNHIINSGNVGPIQYYSLQGSYFINQYLRKLTSYEYKNTQLESLSKNIWKLILSAPAFDKSYILYRFIEDDTHMGYLRIGDIYTVKGFLSTTRDPFYKSNEYKFGFVLIRIKMPANISGAALCIETISHFPSEQEILLAPLTKLRLLNKNENADYYHTDQLFVSEVKTKYEFEYIGNTDIIFDKRLELATKPVVVNFLKKKKMKTFTVNENILYFIKKNVNEFGQFKTLIGNKEYTLNIELYNSISVYSKYYSKKVLNGLSVYLLINNSISFIIEIGEDVDKYFNVNYYFRFSSSNSKDIINKTDFIMFLSLMSYYFDIPKVLIYADYAACEYNLSSCSTTNDSIFRGGNYCLDFYEYLKFKKKKYIEFDSSELYSNFYYYIFDSFKNIDPNRILDRNDRDEIYQIYTKAYYPYFDKRNHNISDFYIWMVNNYCYCLNHMIDKIYRIFPENNPFLNDSYTLNSYLYLYNKKIIDAIDYNQNTNSLSSIKLMNQFKNNYRINIK